MMSLLWFPLLGSYVQKIPFWSLSLVQENPLEALDFIQNNEADLAF